MRLNPGLFILPISLLVAACGTGDDAIDNVRKQPNSFAGAKNPVDDFTPGSTGDSGNNSGLAANEVSITLEVPASLAPDGEPTRRNLRIVQPDSIRVFRTNHSLQDLGEPAISTRKDESGSTLIRFENGLPLAPDVVIEARYGAGILRAVAADADRNIKINPFSEYLVANTIPSYTASEFQQLLDCAKDTEATLCLNKFAWSALADQVHDFEIDIPAGASIASALDVLAARPDFASYVDAMADYALLQEQASGNVSASSADYNPVFMGLELGQTFLESTYAGAGQWGVRMARAEPTGTQDDPAYLYPGLTLASFDIFDIRVTSLATQIPYDRKTLTHKRGSQGYEFFARGPDTWALNTHSTSPGAATLDSNTRLLASRALLQSITGLNSARTIGWTRNPYYMDAYTGGAGNSETGPDRVLSGYFSAGKAIELESVQGKLKRKDELEAHYLSVLELNLLREKGFDTGILNGRNYNTVYLAARFAGSAEPMQVEAGSGTWQINGNSETATITQAQAFTTVSRHASGSVSSDNTGNRSDSWTLSQRAALLSTGNENIGRLNLDVENSAAQFEQPDLGVGASVPDGSLLAFNLAGAASTSGVIGDGLLIAAEQAAAPKPDSGRYRVQGFAVGMKDGLNRLLHLGNGTLELSGATASLESNTLEVLHDVDAGTVSAPVSGQLMSSLAYTGNGNGQVSFSAGNLSLNGFVTADASQFFLVYRDSINGEERSGLLIATKTR